MINTATYKSLLVLFGFVMTQLTFYAQNKEHEGYLFPRNTQEGTIELKWITNKVLYKEGFNLYKSQGSGNWVKLNEKPFVRPNKLPQEIIASDEHAEPIFMMFEEEGSYEAFQEGMARLFYLIRAIKNNDFARAVGLAYSDTEIVSGNTYNYRITALVNGREIEIADTSITAGPYVQSPPPKNIELVRKKRKVEIRWEIDKLAYYGVHVYRTNMKTQETQRLTSEPIVVTEEDLIFNKIRHPNFVDYEIDKETDYTYELKVLDYFGEIGIGSGPLPAAAKDFDPPLDPFGLKYDQDTLFVNLNWLVVEDDDRVGFNIYRYTDSISNKVKINDQPLPKDSLYFRDEVKVPGDYFYVVAAFDTAGNEAISLPIIATIRDVIPPETPTNLQTRADSGMVLLTWNPSPDKDLMGYVIYKVIEGEDVNENDYTLINDIPTQSTQYTEKLHKNVKSSFRYVVEAVDTSYNRSDYSDFSVATLPDHLPPVNPSIRNVSLSEDNKSATIEWEKNADDDIFGYYLWRSEGYDSVPEKTQINLAPFLPFETIYVDEDLDPGKRYVYYLQAVDSARNLSGFSNAFSVITPGPKVSSNLKLKNFSAKLKGEKTVDLKWKVNKPENVLGYVIFRKDGNENLLPLTGNLDKTKYRDRQLKPGTNYQYQIRIYASDGAIIRSEFKQFNIPQDEAE